MLGYDIYVCKSNVSNHTRKSSPHLFIPRNKRAGGVVDQSISIPNLKLHVSNRLTSKSPTNYLQTLPQIFHSPQTIPKMTTNPPKKSPPLPFKTRIQIAVLSAVTDFARRRDGTINRRLLSVLDPFTPPNPKPHRGVRSLDFTVDPTRDLWFRLFLPVAPREDRRRLPVIVFFHGGGFSFLSPATRAYDAVCRRLARKLSAAIVSVNYRLSPEHKHPAQYVDGVDVLRFLDESSDGEIQELDLSNVFLMGDSAGGNIAHHVALLNEASDRVSLSGLILIQPYFGGEERTPSELRLPSAPLVSVERTDWLWKALLPEGEDRDHEACNVFGPRDGRELGEGFPRRAMVVVGGWDPLQDWQRRYAEGLRGRGREARVVEYEDAVHAFYVFPEVKESRMVVEEIRVFMEGCMK